MKLFDKETIIVKTQNVGFSSFLSNKSFRRYKYFPWLKAHRVCQIIGHKGKYIGDAVDGAALLHSCKRCGRFSFKVVNPLASIGKK